jgi:hypothetical protein
MSDDRFEDRDVDDDDDEEEPNPDATKNAFELLGWKWEEESRKMGISPYERTPPEVMEKRMAEFWAVWEEIRKW